MIDTETRTPTAGDLMSRDVETVRADAPLREAAAKLAARGVHGLPVVDDGGRCVGVLSASDVARWEGGRGSPRPRLPQTCTFQTRRREPGGREAVLCQLAQDACPFQRLRALADGRLALACAEPHCVTADWQVVELEPLPADAVGDVMTTTVVTADPDTPAPELARRMVDRRVSRLVVLDPQGRPAGVVTAGDLLHLLAAR